MLSSTGIILDLSSMIPDKNEMIGVVEMQNCTRFIQNRLQVYIHRYNINCRIIYMENEGIFYRKTMNASERAHCTGYEQRMNYLWCQG